MPRRCFCRLCAQWPANGPGHGAGGCQLCTLYARPAGQHSGTSAVLLWIWAFPLALLDVYHANGGESSLLRLAAQSALSGAPCRTYAGCGIQHAIHLAIHSGAASYPQAPGLHPPLLQLLRQSAAGLIGPIRLLCAPSMERGTSGRGHRYSGPAGRAGRQRPPATADGTPLKHALCAAGRSARSCAGRAPLKPALRYVQERENRMKYDVIVNRGRP